MPSDDFDAYIAAAEAAIAKAGEGLERPLAAEVVEDRAPFELVPDARRCPAAADGRHPKAALLLHGLGGTPYEMRDLGRALAQDCYLVRAILLPGHGTVPGDLLHVDYQEWIEATRLGIAGFDGKAERLVLVGFSIGATLALHEALLDEPGPRPELAGVVLLSPMLGTATPLAWLATERLYGDLVPGARWSRVLADGDPVRYESLPRNAEVQRARLIAEVDGAEKPLELPVYLAISASDAEVDPVATRDWLCERASGARRLIWYTPEPAPGTWCGSVVERPSATAAGILDFAHIALPIAPDNPRYGAGSAYLDCSHYYWEVETPSWFICMDPARTPANSEVRLGEITEANLQRHVVRRLTYNPDFDAMVQDLLALLAEPG
jgi:esterase/lipase